MCSAGVCLGSRRIWRKQRELKYFSYTEQESLRNSMVEEMVCEKGKELRFVHFCVPSPQHAAQHTANARKNI